jgi:inorganic pyrophosphatase
VELQKGLRSDMAKKKHKRSKGLADPVGLAPYDKEDGLTVVIIETPKGSRNKYAYDPKERVFELRKVLPAGMTFPYDFGFIPSTLAEDGDPLDVLVLMEEPAFAGCKLKCRLLGIIEGEQGTKKERVRNDRVVAIASENHSLAQVRQIKDLGGPFVRELEDFFVNFHRLSGKEYRILGCKGPAAASRAIKRSQTSA